MIPCMGRVLIPLILWWVMASASASESSGESAPYAVSRDPSPCLAGSESWSIVSPWQSGTNSVEVVVPSGYAQGSTYPVVYLLPVNAGTKGPWGHPLEEIIKHGLADRYQAICVTPSFALLPWYGNNSDNPAVHQTEHLLKAVVPVTTRSTAPIIWSASANRPSAPLVSPWSIPGSFPEWPCLRTGTGNRMRSSGTPGDSRNATDRGRSMISGIPVIWSRVMPRNSREPRPGSP